MMVWKMFLLFQGCILRFHVNLARCKRYTLKSVYPPPERPDWHTSAKFWKSAPRASKVAERPPFKTHSRGVPKDQMVVWWWFTMVVVVQSKKWLNKARKLRGKFRECRLTWGPSISLVVLFKVIWFMLTEIITHVNHLHRWISQMKNNSTTQ